MLNVWLYPETYEGIFLFPVAYLIYKFRLYDRARDFKDYSWHGKQILAGNFVVSGNAPQYDFYVSQRPMLKAILPDRPYRWISFGISVSFCVIMLLFTNFFDGKNILLLRVATGFAAPGIANGAGHYFVWLALFLVFMRFGGLGNFTGDFDFLKAGYTMVFFGAIHELMWYVGYFVTYHLSSFNPETWLYYWPFLLLMASFLFGYFLLFQKRTLSWKKIAGFVIFISIFYVMWVEAGFPITIDVLNGNTNLYSNLVVNFIEDSSWIFPALYLVL